MRRVLATVLGAALGRLVRGGGRRPPAEPPPEPPPRPPGPAQIGGADAGAREPSARSELPIAALLLLAGAAGVAAVVVYALGADTQALGIALGLCLAAIAGAAGLAGTHLLPGRQVVEPREPPASPAGQRAAEAAVAATGAGITRKRLLLGASGVAGAGLAGALIAPAASLGPAVGDRIKDTPWAPGVRLVDAEGRPIAAASIVVGGFLTAYPEGADRNDLGSPVVVVRLDPEEVDLPPERRDWAPLGILAYSKICTHAACAVSLFRYPSFPSRSPEPGLVCPCHYSTFDPRTGGTVTFGPAGRPLPQLPLDLTPDGHLVARDDFPDQIGPSYLRVRR
jgi:ubiquinol-cytochrome c reductase iron-sulfur subunit